MTAFYQSRAGHETDLVAAILNADSQAIFILDGRLRIHHANARAKQLRSRATLFKPNGERLYGRTNQVDFQLQQALRLLLAEPEAQHTGRHRPSLAPSGRPV